jgi:fatty-acyl-CoA synthase
LCRCNPPDGVKKIGSVGLPFPYTEVRILQKNGDDGFRECAVDEVGEICVSNPGVYEGSTYTEEDKNRNLFAEGRFLRTGDLGRMDSDGYLYITGRAKDLIIRGGHNIDPAMIEEALAGHPAVAMAGAIGQPDAKAGELPAAYVELVSGATVTPTELLEYSAIKITERAAVPKHVEVLPELPKTAIGKVFKPDLRKLAIIRVYDAALAEAGVEASVAGGSRIASAGWWRGCAATGGRWTRRRWRRCWANTRRPGTGSEGRARIWAFLQRAERQHLIPGIDRPKERGAGCPSF